MSETNSQPQQAAVPLPPGTTVFAMVALADAGAILMIPRQPMSVADKLFLAGLLQEGVRQALEMPVAPPQGQLVLPAGPIPDAKMRRR